MTQIKKEEYDQYLKEEYLSAKEASEFLEITEDELKVLVTKHQIPSHTVAGVFLRLKKTEIEDLKIKWRIERELFPQKSEHFQHETVVSKAGLGEKLSDFWYFNDFYILCSVLIMLLLYTILSTH